MMHINHAIRARASSAQQAFFIQSIHKPRLKRRLCLSIRLKQGVFVSFGGDL